MFLLQKSHDPHASARTKYTLAFLKDQGNFSGSEQLQGETHEDGIERSLWKWQLDRIGLQEGNMGSR
jgi:hypothetical protein